MTKQILALVGLALLTLSANAALISRDLHTAGDGLITYDDSTGLEWLDLTMTVNRSHNDISSQLLPGGEFSGWMYASMEQVHQLFDSAGGNGEYRNTNNTLENAWVPSLVGIWGVTLSIDTAFQSRFFTGDTFAPTTFDHTIVGNIGYNTINGTPEENSYVATLYSAGPKDWSDPYYGSALIRTSVVPIPAGAWLFGSALIGLAGIGRKRQS